jgi:predicted aspartyl protease
MDMLCGSGIFGIETSRCSQHPQTPKFLYEGHCLRMGKTISMKDFGPQVNTTEMPQCPMILIIGSSMSSGKTCTGRVIIDIIKNNIGANKVAAAKFTGAGYNHDANQFCLAGSDFVCDFIDAGFPSTVIPAEEYREMALPRMLGMLAEQKPDCIVAEVGASPFEPYNGAEVLRELLGTGADNIYLMICANDAYGVLGLKQVLMSEGTNVQPNNILGVSGLAACNDAGVALVERVTGLRAFNMKDPDSVDNLRVLLEKRLFC